MPLTASLITFCLLSTSIFVTNLSSKVRVMYQVVFYSYDFPLRTGFDTRPIDVVFMVDKEAVGQLFLLVLPISPLSNKPSILHTGLPIFILMLVVPEGREGEFSEPSKKLSFGYRGTLDRQVFSRSIFFNPKSEHWCYDNSSAQSAT